MKNLTREAFLKSNSATKDIQILQKTNNIPGPIKYLLLVVLVLFLPSISYLPNVSQNWQAACVVSDSAHSWRQILPYKFFSACREAAVIPSRWLLNFLRDGARIESDTVCAVLKYSMWASISHTAGLPSTLLMRTVTCNLLSRSSWKMSKPPGSRR